jgi:hypothetical protein
MMGFLVGVAVVVGLLWLAWRFSPRRRMTRNRPLGEISHGERSDANVNFAIIEQQAKNIRDSDSGGYGPW